MAQDERVTVRIESHTTLGLDLLPDVLRQLGAMVRLLTEFATDPRYSKVEVLGLTKASPLEARLRVVTVREPPKEKGKARRKARVTGNHTPIRRLERAYAEATGQIRPRVVDATGLTVLADVARLLKSDIATISTASTTMEVSHALIDQINLRLGTSSYSRGSITGILEGLNVHSKPWSFTIYPEIGPSRIRCTFGEDQFAEVQRGIRNVVRVVGMKEYVSGCAWPVKMAADRISILEPAAPGAWLELVDNLVALWDQADEDERLMIVQEQSA